MHVQLGIWHLMITKTWKLWCRVITPFNQFIIFVINLYFLWSLYFKVNSRYLQTINYDFCLKLVICYLLIVSKVVVKQVLGNIRDMVMQNMCFISINKQPIGY